MLLFVFRDRTKTPLARLVETWEEDLHRMWAAIPKPPALEGTSVTDFFEVLLFARLSNAYRGLENDLLRGAVHVNHMYTVRNRKARGVDTSAGQVCGAAQL